MKRMTPTRCSTFGNWRAWCVIAPVLVLATAAGAAFSTIAAPTQIVLRQVTLNDPGSNNMPSHTVLVPRDWKTEGGGWWAGAQWFNIPPSQNIKVTAPDGRQVTIGPGIGATDFIPSPQGMQMNIQRPAPGSTDKGYPVIYMPTNLDQWRQWLQTQALPQSYPQARGIQVTKLEVIPELTAMLQQQLQPIRQMQAQMDQQTQMTGMQSRSICDGAVLSATCTYQQDGKKWELLLVFGTTYIGLEAPFGTQFWWSIEPNVSFRAPAGQLEANLPLMMTVANSVRPTPQWAKMKADHAAKMNQIAAKGAAERSRIIADSNRQISRMRNEAWQQQQASQDSSHRRFINAIREVDDYTTPDGDTIQLPSHYNHVYTNGNNEYILTNDTGYNPNADQSINNRQWQTMTVAKP